MPAIRSSNTVFALFVVFGLSCMLWEARIGSAQTPHESRSIPSGNSSRDARDTALKGIPYAQLTAQAGSKIRSVAEHSSYFRRMPTQTIECEPEMFTCLVRNPEIIVNIWDVMGITKVSLQRVSQYQHQGDDGSGTTCKMDLVFGSDSTHVYYVTGGYRGNLWPKDLNGHSVILLHHHAHKSAEGTNQVTVTMDIFLKLENIGADLVVRTLGPLVSKSADYNFIECVAFVSQVSQVAVTNPQGLQNLASRLQQLDPKVREQFVTTAKTVASRSNRLASKSNFALTPSGYSVEEVFVSDAMQTRSKVPVIEPMIPSDALPPVSTRRSQLALTEEGEMGQDSPTIQKIHRGQP